MWPLRKEPARTPDPADALRCAIRERVDRAIAGDLDASDATADEVRRLTQLLAAYEQTRPAPPRRVWPVITLLLAIAVAVSLLLALRVPSTEVTLALDLSSLGFRIGNDPEAGAPEQVGLVGRLVTEEMAIDGVGAVDLDDLPVPIPDAADFALRTTGEGSISLRPLAVPVGTWVRVDRPDASGALTLELAHPQAELEVVLTLPAEVEVRPPESGLARALDGGSGGQRVVFRAAPPAGGDECARLRLRWHGSPAPAAAAAGTAADLAPFQGALPVDALLLTDLAGGAQRTQFSTVLGGALYLEAVAGREIALRRHQLLDVGLGPVRDAADSGRLCAATAPAAAAPGRLWRIAVGPEAIALEGEATVTRLSTGTAEYRQDLMPRWLEWLQTRQELLLFWGAFGSLFGLAYTVLLWWRGTR